jgi:hypothetical protein
LVSIGQVPWSRDAMISQLREFAELYDTRPIRHNVGGMRSPHMFLTWFLLRSLRPTTVVESGVWLGLGTWLIEKACPDARLYCLDPVLDRLRYRSKSASYIQKDFTEIDWTTIPRGETVLFFDDHQNAYERVRAAKWFGFRHLIFEDNYPPSRGDCYTLKKAFAHAGSRSRLSVRDWMARKMRGILGAQINQDVGPNAVDDSYLRRHVEIYWECPPIFRTDRTRWGDLWTDDRYPTPPALLESVEHDYQRLFLEEAQYYTWMCYVRLT